jgi:hypothetical protein
METYQATAKKIDRENFREFVCDWGLFAQFFGYFTIASVISGPMGFTPDG